MLRVIGDGRDIPDGEVPDGLGDEDLVRLFRWIVLLRTFDERAVALQRQGRIGAYPPFWGEEGTQAGALYACEDDDWVFPTYRQCAVGVLRGIPISTILGWARGIGGAGGFYNPRQYRVAPICTPVGTHLPHAVGLAWAARMRGDSAAALAWFGDGATSEGDFHEGMNFASVFKTPTVFFCVNNQWAISTPITRQMATDTIAVKAEAYAMPGVRVDGFDPIACWKVTRDALDRARAGDGPTLVEAYCYRIGPHGTADDPSRYRDESEAERWRPLEPVSRMGGFLQRHELLDEDGVQAIGEEAKERVAAAVRELEATQPPGPEVLFQNVYASGPPRAFAEQLEDLRGADREDGGRS